MHFQHKCEKQAGETRDMHSHCKSVWNHRLGVCVCVCAWSSSRWSEFFSFLLKLMQNVSSLTHFQVACKQAQAWLSVRITLSPVECLLHRRFSMIHASCVMWVNLLFKYWRRHWPCLFCLCLSLSVSCNGVRARASVTLLHVSLDHWSHFLSSINGLSLSLAHTNTCNVPETSEWRKYEWSTSVHNLCFHKSRLLCTRVHYLIETVTTVVSAPVQVVSEIDSVCRDITSLPPHIDCSVGWFYSCSQK